MTLMPVLPIEAIVFDFDGVLVHSNLDGNPFHLFAGQVPTADPKLHEAFKKIQCHKFQGTDWISDLAAAGVDTSNRHLVYRISDAIFELSKDKRAVYPAMVEILSPLAKRVPLAILSNNCRLSVFHCLPDHAKLFQIIITFEDLERLKPDPEGLLTISDELGINPANILLVGDSWDDIAAARSAGTQIAVATWGQHFRLDLLGGDTGDIITLTRPQMLLELIPTKRSIE